MEFVKSGFELPALVVEQGDFSCWVALGVQHRRQEPLWLEARELITDDTDSHAAGQRRVRPARRSAKRNFSDHLIGSQNLQHGPHQITFGSYEPVPLFAPLLMVVKPPVVQEPSVDHQHAVVRQLLIEASGERFLALRVRTDFHIQQEMRPECHQTDHSGLWVRAFTVRTT